MKIEQTGWANQKPNSSVYSCAGASVDVDVNYETALAVSRRFQLQVNLILYYYDY